MHQYGLSYLWYLNDLEKSAWALQNPSLRTKKRTWHRSSYLYFLKLERNQRISFFIIIFIYFWFKVLQACWALSLKIAVQNSWNLKAIVAWSQASKRVLWLQSFVVPDNLCGTTTVKLTASVIFLIWYFSYGTAWLVLLSPSDFCSKALLFVSWKGF